VSEDERRPGRPATGRRGENVIQVYLSDEDADLLRKLARKEDRSLTGVVRIALRERAQLAGFYVSSLEDESGAE